VTERISVIRRLSTAPYPEQNNHISEKVGNRVYGIRYKGMAISDYTGYKLEANQKDINESPYQRDGFGISG
jgi:hypothetical protein